MPGITRIEEGFFNTHCFLHNVPIRLCPRHLLTSPICETRIKRLTLMIEYDDVSTKHTCFVRE